MERIKAAQKGKLAGDKNPSARAVVCLTSNRIFLTMKEAGEWLGMKGSNNISSVCTGKLKTYGSHKWRYATDEEREEEISRRAEKTA